MSPILPSIRRRDLMLGLAALPLAGAARAEAAQAAGTDGRLQLVATFTEPRQVTGVAVSREGRIFVNFPRWEEDVPVSVAEVLPGGALRPFPDAAWNAYRDADRAAAAPASSFVCVQSVTVDAQNRLWILDPAAPDATFIVDGGPKLVCVDLATNQVSRVCPFGPDVAPQGTYLNDIRLTPDGTRAVITNSGMPGSLVVVELGSGAARRVLDGDPSTQLDPDLVVTVNGAALRQADGLTAQFSADGLIVDHQEQYAYWQATTGTTAYRAPVAALFDASLSAVALSAEVQVVGKGFVADGYWLSSRNAPFLTSPGDSSVKRLLPDNGFATVVQDPRLLWPDSMAEGPDGSIYVTASHIPQMRMYGGPGVRFTQLFRFQPG